MIDITLLSDYIFVLGFSCLFCYITFTSKDNSNNNMRILITLVLMVFILILENCSFLLYENYGDVYLLNNSIVSNLSSVAFKLLISLSSIIYLFLFFSYFYDSGKNDFIFNFPVKEFLILFGTLIIGMFLMVSCNNMLLLYMAIEIQSLCFYVFPALRKISNLSIEASIKYYIYSITSTVIFLIGLSFIYGSFGTVNFSELSLLLPGATNDLTLNVSLFFVSVLILFKLAIFPSHIRIPAVYEGSPLIITLFFATIAKIPFIFSLIKFISLFTPFSPFSLSILQFLAVCSIIYGSMVALTQTKLKKLLAYSAVSHMGFILPGIIQNTIDGISAGIFHFIIYLFLTFSIFAILISYRYLRNNDIIELDKTTDLIRIYNTNPILAFIFATFLLSMAGIPPFIGFFSK